MKRFLYLSHFFSSFITILSLSVPYYYNPHIHNFGNIGIGGKIHAELGPLFTKIIDNTAYDGRDIRSEIMEPYKNKKVIDLCCGTGLSTLENNLGIDTSNEMLNVARRYNNKSNFKYGNAEFFGNDKDFDIATCFFSFHEMPNYAHLNIIENCKRIAKKEIIIVDISTKYTPSNIMLSGEPYLLNYLESIDNILSEFNKSIYIENHIDIWRLKL
jgi:ubiquinone/menaquinone biosynthesis C-methylase UbiE